MYDHSEALLLTVLSLLVILACASFALILAIYQRPPERHNVVQLVGQSLGSMGSIGSVRGAIEGPEIDAIKAGIGFGSGDAYYVSESGSDANDCSSWEAACASAAYVMQTHVISGNGDVVYLAPGLYDENTSRYGLVIDKSVASVVGLEPNVGFENTNTANGTVISVTAGVRSVLLRGFSVFKNEFVSSSSTDIYLDDVGTVFLEDLIVAVPPVSGHRGIFVNSGDGIFMDNIQLSGLAPVGTGIIFSDTVRSALRGSGVGRVGTGLLFDGTTNEIIVTGDTIIFSTLVGARLEPGVTQISLCADIVDSTVEVLNLSGDDTSTTRCSLTSLRNTAEHSGVYQPCTPYVVLPTGNDDSNCRSAEEACLTVARAVDVALAAGNGNCVHIGADGVYSETLVIPGNVQLIGSQGVVISSTSTTSPTVTIAPSAQNTAIIGPLKIASENNIGLAVQADDVLLDGIEVVASTSAYSITGADVDIRNIRASGYTESGMNLCAGADNPRVVGAFFDGVGASVIGLWISSADVDNGFFRGIDTVNNATNGVSVTLGATGHAFINITSGFDGADTGAAWDDPNLLLNSRKGYVRRSDFRRSESTYPSPLGDGTAAALPIISTAGTQWTYGASTIVLSNTVIAEEFDWVGVYVEPGTANKRIKTECAVTSLPLSAQRNGGAAWSIGVQELTTDGAYTFAVGDRAVIVGQNDTSEWVTVQVVTSTTVVRVSALTVNHSGDPRIFLVDKPVEWYASSNNTRSGFEKAITRRAMRPGDGVVCHSLNATDALSSDEAVGLRIER